MKGTAIGQYHELAATAGQLEREGEFGHAKKVWEKAIAVCEQNHAMRARLLHWAQTRQEFCAMALKRAKA